MITLHHITPDLTYLDFGLRPNGRYEIVNTTTGQTLFLTNPLNLGVGSTEVIDICVTPLDTPFDKRPRQFITTLRDQRLECLKDSRKAKRAKKTTEGLSSDGTTTRAVGRKPKSIKLSLATTATLDKLGADGDKLKAMFAAFRK